MEVAVHFSDNDSDGSDACLTCSRGARQRSSTFKAFLVLILRGPCCSQVTTRFKQQGKMSRVFWDLATSNSRMTSTGVEKADMNIMGLEGRDEKMRLR